MDRRRFLLTSLAGACAAPLAATAHAQGPSPPLIAILDSGSPVGQGPWMLAFKQALAELGWVDGRSVRFETRHAGNRLDRMAAAAKEVVTLSQT
jgi:putative ABC transport system substrate-binding protein